MATYVSFKKARRFPQVLRYLNPQNLRKQVKALASFTRATPGITNQSRMSGQIDVSAITGVPALKRTGRLLSSN